MPRLKRGGMPFSGGDWKTEGPNLWRVGKTGRLVSIFLPAKIGEPAACATFSDQQYRLLQTLVRETTRARKKRRRSISEAEVTPGNQVVAFHGKKLHTCPLLSDDKTYVGFNGNGKLRGHGYRLTSGGGWLVKAGYPLTDVRDFLGDLATLAQTLQLVVVGVGPGTQFVGLDQMQVMEATLAGRRTLERLHVRVYTDAAYLERWTGFFQGTEIEEAPASPSPVDGLAGLLAEMQQKRISGRALAAGIRKDPSFIGKVLNGKKPWPRSLLEKAQAWVASQEEAKLPVVATPTSARKKRRPADGSLLNVALDLLDRGWAIVPQLPGAKKPCVRWKPFQERRPTEEELTDWFQRWPDAGLALVLGPVSNVLAIDVDGEEAHQALMQRLGAEPLAPKALSGSRKPYRYHLFFRCPDLPTKAKQTPWHPNLEFRGQGGIVVIPPSQHKSGNRYVWETDRSPDDLDLPDVPAQVLEALKPLARARPLPKTSGRHTLAVRGIDASPRTLEFLSGNFAEGPLWNQKLFAAACDLCGRGMPVEEGEPLLLAGAQPWNRGEEELAQRTIASAYSQHREPARL